MGQDAYLRAALRRRKIAGHVTTSPSGRWAGASRMRWTPGTGLVNGARCSSTARRSSSRPGATSPRYGGVRSFLVARGNELPACQPSDRPSVETVAGLGNRQNELVLRLIHEQGVEAYTGSVRYVGAAREAGLRRAVVSSSSKCREVLLAAAIEGLFERRIDGVVAERDHLKGKPAPDMFLAGAWALGVEPGQAAVFEDALAGVAAGRVGGFVCVVGVDRAGEADELRAHGADLVVSDLAELLAS
jgi:HAD superfamily hydrolase (TIGR01509 family)